MRKILGSIAVQDSLSQSNNIQVHLFVYLFYYLLQFMLKLQKEKNKK